MYSIVPRPTLLRAPTQAGLFGACLSAAEGGSGVPNEPCPACLPALDVLGKVGIQVVIDNVLCTGAI